MIVSGHFVDIDFNQGIKACFITDDEKSLYVQTNIYGIWELLYSRLKTQYDITSRHCLLELKEIEKDLSIPDVLYGKSVIQIERWYILEAMVFGE